MKETEVPAPHFDLEMTLNSGQVFHWEKVGAGFYGTIEDRATYVEQRGATLRVATEGGAVRRDDKRGVVNSAPGSRELAPPVSELVRHYFALDHPLDEICASFPRDPPMNAARDFCRGLRIIRQPKWEEVRSATAAGGALAAKEARRRDTTRRSVCAPGMVSPSSRRPDRNWRVIRWRSSFRVAARADRFAEASENELRKCGLGYRAKNLLATAKRVALREAALDSWSALPDGELREQLCHLPGVGAKVANCVMLFGYERVKAFPIDVWIERVLREKYFPRKRKVTSASLAEFAANYFGGHGGYAQQYLFHHARMTGRNRRKA